MKHPECCWSDTAFDGVHRRNHVVDVRQITATLPPGKRECYATWHRFPEAYHTHWGETGSTGNYRGDSYADFLPFDFDGPELAAVQQRVAEFLKMLELTYEIEGLHGVRCYFSGKKGFHICLSSALFGGWEPGIQLAGRLRRLAKTMAQAHVIDAAIYDQNRLLRLPNTRHGQSGLWKVPVTPGELFGLTAQEILTSVK